VPGVTVLARRELGVPVDLVHSLHMLSYQGENFFLSLCVDFTPGLVLEPAPLLRPDVVPQQRVSLDKQRTRFLVR